MKIRKTKKVIRQLKERRIKEGRMICILVSFFLCIGERRKEILKGRRKRRKWRLEGNQGRSNMNQRKKKILPSFFICFSKLADCEVWRRWRKQGKEEVEKEEKEDGGKEECEEANMDRNEFLPLFLPLSLSVWLADHPPRGTARQGKTMEVKKIKKR